MLNAGSTTDAQPTGGRPAFKPGEELAAYSLTLYRRPGSFVATVRDADGVRLASAEAVGAMSAWSGACVAAVEALVARHPVGVRARQVS